MLPFLFEIITMCVGVGRVIGVITSSSTIRLSSCLTTSCCATGTFLGG